MELGLTTIERLRKQEKLLEKIYRANYEVNPHSHATKTSRSNLIALQHTTRQLCRGRRLSGRAGTGSLPLTRHRKKGLSTQDKPSSPENTAHIEVLLITIYRRMHPPGLG